MQVPADVLIPSVLEMNTHQQVNSYLASNKVMAPRIDITAPVNNAAMTSQQRRYVVVFLAPLVRALLKAYYQHSFLHQECYNTPVFLDLFPYVAQISFGKNCVARYHVSLN